MKLRCFLPFSFECPFNGKALFLACKEQSDHALKWFVRHVDEIDYTNNDHFGAKC